jgi:carbonic anhydrase
LNIASRHEHIQNRRSMGIHRNPNLWQSLPAKAEFEFQEREDVVALDTEITFLSAQLAKADSQEAAHQIHLQRRRVQNQKDKLYLEELKRQREVQQGTQTGSVYEQTLFHYRRRAMPERDLLAQILPTRSTIRSSAGLDAMKALETICSQYHPVGYRPGLRPVNGKCMCGESVDKYGFSCSYTPPFTDPLGFTPIVNGYISIGAITRDSVK